MTKYQYPLQNLDCVKIQNSGVVFFLYTMRTDSHESRACIFTCVRKVFFVYPYSQWTR